MIGNVVNLIRRFMPISSRSKEWDFLVAESGKPKGWHEIEDGHRTRIITDPGAWKTFEASTRARKMRERGRMAFFVRIEKFDGSVAQAFEIGTTEGFSAWLG